MHAGRARRPVSHPGHPYLADHGGKRPLMTGLDPGASHPVRAGHPAAAFLAGRAQVQMSLQQQPAECRKSTCITTVR